jgi:hypothetical protein
VAVLFNDLLAKGTAAGYFPDHSEQSLAWFRTQAGRMRSSPDALIGAGGSALTSHPLMGSLYLFAYDPKFRETLPYYDTFPLVIPFKTATVRSVSDKLGFYGLNFHYLPLKLRAVLMDALYSTLSNEKFDATTKFNLSYRLLNGVSQFKYFKPCVKHYLMPQVRSQFLYIAPSEWNIALFLPLARFEKASQARVWTDSEAAL